MKKITEDQFYNLLAAKLSGDITAEELDLLQQQLLLDQQWRLLHDQVIKNDHTSIDDHTQQAYALHLVKMQLQGKLAINEINEPELPSKGRVIPLYNKLVYASLVAATIIGFVFYGIKQLYPVRVEAKSVTTVKGVKSYFKLPDGTQVWLNADSKIAYINNLKGDTREVSLIGEAYFDVVHDASHPFIIHTGKANIRVLGTAFNIRNYPADKSLETTLMRGKIEVSFIDRPGEKIILKPLEKLIIAKNDNNIAAINHNTGQSKPGNKVILTSVTYARDMVAETSWMRDKLVFSNTSLGSIAEELERRFAVTIIFKTPAVQEYRYTAVFDAEPIEKVLEYIKLAKKIDYKIEGKLITIQ